MGKADNTGPGVIQIGLFYGSSTGTTAAAAEQIQAEFSRQFALEIDLLDVAEYFLDEMLHFDYLIVGIPTWNIGQLQRDWETVIDEFETLDLQGKQAAVFGLGDQVGYPDTFVDAMVFVAERMEAQGAVLAGAWPIQGYTFTQSWAVRGGRFVGLVLDADNQPELTSQRIASWVSQLGTTWGLVRAGEDTQDE